MTLKNRCLVNIILAFGVLSQLPAQAAEKDGVMGLSTLSLNVSRGDQVQLKDMSDLKTKVAPMLKQHKFDQLDALAETIRKANVHYSDGRMKLEYFYSGLDFDRQKTDNEWQTHLDDLKEWIKQKPKSITARASLIDNYADYAWKSRGGGYANTVGEKQWKEFSKRLAEGHQAFLEGKKLASVCPHLYVAAAQIGLGESWEKSDYTKLIDEANSKFPDYYEVYFRKVYYLQPRWHGDDNEWADYAAQTADKIGGVRGDTLYARMAWYVDQLNFYENIFTEFPHLRWSRVDKGFQALVKEYPNSIRVKSELCHLAIQAHDKALVKKLFEQLGDNVDVSVWKKKLTFLKARESAKSTGSAKSNEPARTKETKQ